MEKISNLVDDAIKQFIGNQKTTTIDDRTGGKTNIYIAHLFAWDGREQEIEIEPEWIDDILSAVQGQYTFINNEKKFGIHGGNYKHVDIYYRGDK